MKIDLETFTPKELETLDDKQVQRVFKMLQYCTGLARLEWEKRIHQALKPKSDQAARREEETRFRR